MELKTVPIANIMPLKNNPRGKINTKDESFKALVESVKAVGVIVPLHGVEGKDGIVELSAGHRRFEAAKIAELAELKVLVSKENGATSASVTHYENMHRENLTVMQLLKSYELMLAACDGDTDKAAANLGLTKPELARCINLSKLIPEWRKMASQDDFSVTLEALGIIARLPKESQKRVAGWHEYSRGVDTKELKRRIDMQITCSLETAPFDVKSCKKCTARSDNKSQVTLFADDNLKHAHCLNKVCFNEKAAKAIAAKIHDEWATAPGSFIITRTQYTPISSLVEDILLTKKDLPNSIKEHWTITKCKKSDKGAKKVVDMAKPNTVTYGKIGKASSGTTSTSKPRMSDLSPEKQLKAKEQKIRGLRLLIVIDQYNEHLNARELPVDANLTSIAAIFALMGSSSKTEHSVKTIYSFSKPRDILDKLSEYCDPKKDQDVQKLMWARLRGHFKIGAENGSAALEQEDRIKLYANLIDFDFDAAMKEATEEKPNPKGLVRLRDQLAAKKTTKKKPAQKKS